MLFADILLGSIGTAYFIYGKKQGRPPHLIAGVIFTVYPYFAESLTALVGVGVALSVALWLAVRAGW